MEKRFLWEHLGMMTDPIYCQKAMKKMTFYTKMGLYKVEDIIYTFESEKHGGKLHQSNILYIKRCLEKEANQSSINQTVSDHIC